MGIEPTQPDEVRSRTVLKTVRATRLHPLPLHLRKHETERLTLHDLTDLDAVWHSRKIVREPGRGHEHQHAARRLRIDDEGAVRVGRAAPRDARREIRLIAFGAAGAHTALT